MAVKKKRLSAAARRAQLIEVGRTVFAERGYEATSVEELASTAGVSKPVLYEHFGGKQGLYAVIVDREIEAVVGRISAAIQSGPPRARLEGAIVVFLRWVRDKPRGFAILRQESPGATHEAGMASLLSIVAERVGNVFVDMFAKAGYPPDVGPIYAHALVGMVTFVGKWWTESQEAPIDQVAAHMASMVWMGLRHLPTEPSPIDMQQSDED